MYEYRQMCFSNICTELSESQSMGFLEKIKISQEELRRCDSRASDLQAFEEPVI
jgi:hypothetical protein